MNGAENPLNITGRIENNGQEAARLINIITALHTTIVNDDQYGQLREIRNLQLAIEKILSSPSEKLHTVAELAQKIISLYDSLTQNEITTRDLIRALTQLVPDLAADSATVHAENLPPAGNFQPSAAETSPVWAVESLTPAIDEKAKLTKKILRDIDTTIAYLGTGVLDTQSAEHFLLKLTEMHVDTGLLTNRNIVARILELRLEILIAKFAHGMISTQNATKSLRAIEQNILQNEILSNDALALNRLQRLNDLVDQRTEELRGETEFRADQREVAQEVFENWADKVNEHPQFLVIAANHARNLLNTLLRNPDTADPRTASVAGVNIVDYLKKAAEEGAKIISSIEKTGDIVGFEKARILNRLYIDVITNAHLEASKKIRELNGKSVSNFIAELQRKSLFQRISKVLETPVPDDKLDTAITTYQQILIRAQEKISQEYPSLSPDQIEALNKEYWNKLRDLITRLEEKRANLVREKEDADIEAEFEKQVQTLRELILVGESINRNQKQRSKEVTLLRDNIITGRRILNNQSFKQTYQSKALEIESLLSRANALVEELAELISFFENEELSYMPLEELARLAKSTDSDPFLYERLREGGADARKFAIAKAAQRRLFGKNPEHTSSQDFERLTWKVWLQLAFLDAKLQAETEVASTAKMAGANDNGIGGILETQMRERIVARKELIMVLAQNPRWGEQFKLLRDAARIYAGLKPPSSDEDRSKLPPRAAVIRRLKEQNIEKLPMMSRDGQIVLFNGRIYEYDQSKSYAALTDETRGRANLQRLVSTFSLVDTSDPQAMQFADKQAIEFAQLAFTTFSLLDDSYAELQASTMTRAHNPTEPDIGFLSKGLAAAVHRVMRYSQPSDSSIQWWKLVDISKIPEYYFRNNDVKHKFLHRLDLYTAFQECFYDTDSFFGKIKFPKFLEFVFPTTTAFTELIRGETLWIPNPDPSRDESILVDHLNRHLLYKNRDGRIFNPQRRMVGRIVASRNQNNAINTVNEEENAEGGFFIPTNSNKQININDAKISVTLEDGTKVKVGINDKTTSRELYYNALDGFARVVKMSFGAVPGGLDRKQIIDAKNTAKPPILHEYLSQLGRAKMTPGDHIDEYAGPMLNRFVFRLISSFNTYMPEDRKLLVAEIISILSQASNYGGLSYSNIRTQVDEVIDSLTTSWSNAHRMYRNVNVTFWNKDGTTVDKKVHLANSVRPYEQWRRRKILDFAIKWFHHEHPGKRLPAHHQSKFIHERKRKWWKFWREFWRAESLTGGEEMFYRLTGDETSAPIAHENPLSTEVGIADLATSSAAKH